jgi:hypothetical protein
MSFSQEIVFRPFTEEEKKEFIESLDDKGRQILEELAWAKKLDSSTTERGQAVAPP